MELSALLDNTRYCVGSSARGVGSWTYVTLLGHQIKEHWQSSEFRANVLVETTFSVPKESKWHAVRLPDSLSIVVREHMGNAVPELRPINWATMPTASSLRKSSKKLATNVPVPAPPPAKPTPAATPAATPSVSEAVEDAVDAGIRQTVFQVVEEAATTFVSTLYSQQP